MGDAAQIRTVVVPENWPKTLEEVRSQAPAQMPDEITPEIVAVIQAAANEFFGRRVRVVSIRIPRTSYADSEVWLQRGRDTVQASHNLVQLRH
jgi:hypothetical protein